MERPSNHPSELEEDRKEEIDQMAKLPEDPAQPEAQEPPDPKGPSVGDAFRSGG